MQNNFKSRAVASGITFIALASLAACGGGGDDAAPAVPASTASPAAPAAPAPVVNLTTVSPADAQRLTGRAVSSLGFAASSASSSAQLYTTATTTSAASGSAPCPLGGTAAYSRVDADNNGRVTAGDMVTLTGSNCRFSQSGITGSLDGSLSASVLAVTGTPYAGSNWRLSVVQTNTALTAVANGQSVSLNGAVQIDASPTDPFASPFEFTGQFDFRARFDNLSVRNGASGGFTNLVSGEITSRATREAPPAPAPVPSPAPGAPPTPAPAPIPATTLRVGFSNLNLQTQLVPGQTVNVTINTSGTGLGFGGGNQLLSGSATVTTGSIRLIVTALGANQVRLDTDNNSDGVIDATQTLTWTALTAAGNL